MDGRRMSHSGRETPTRENPDVFDDEYEEDDFDGFGIADGFRPGPEREAGMGEHDPPITSISAHHADAPLSPMNGPTPSRESTRKVRPVQDNPFASPEDGPLDRSASITSHGTSQYAPGITHRVSTASSHQYAPASSRFDATAGPSHPYGMYAQDTIPRSPSVATTIRPPPGGPQSRAGPTHPYALYPQGIEPDADEEAQPHNPVTVGFPGLGQSYARRLGPDGEEQDIIGADGHAEQLPPYSRYPEDGPEKPLLAALDVPPPVAHSRGPVAGNDPGMPLMHEMQHPLPQQQQPQSMTDNSRLSLRQSHDRQPSMPNLERMRSPSGSRSSAGTNKSWSEKSWKEKRRTRFMGVPFWWILLGGGVLAFIAIAIGSAIGGFLGSQKDNNSSVAVTTVVSTSLYDASLIATPSSASPPTGTFALSLSTPQETQASCIEDQNYAAAWSCDLAGVAAEAIDVKSLKDAGGPLGASLYYASDDTEVRYGTQRQVLETEFSPFLTVTDNDDPDNGPAYYFQAQYNKVVVVPENAIAYNSKKKRQTWSLPTNFVQKQVIDPGEKPWFCYWNNTLLEGFIYVTNPVANGFSLSSSISTSTPASVISNSALSTALVSGALPSSSMPLAEALAQNAPVTSSFTQHNPVPTGSVAPVSFSNSFDFQNYYNSQQHKEEAEYDDDDDDDFDDDDNGKPRKSRRRRRRQEPDADDAINTLGLYPYLVKLEERRLPNNPVQPFCQQFQILDNGHAGFLDEPEGSGNPIIVQIEENDPAFSAYEASSDVEGKVKLVRNKKRAMVEGGCHCQWMSGQ